MAVVRSFHTTGNLTCTVTCQHYTSLLQQSIIPALQIGDVIQPPQDGAPPHIARCVKQLLRHHFDDNRIINRKFPTGWPSRSSDLHSCGYLLRGWLKAMVYGDPITFLSDFKENVGCHVRNIPQFMLLSTVEYAILRFLMVADNGGHHIDHVS